MTLTSKELQEGVEELIRHHYDGSLDYDGFDVGGMAGGVIEYVQEHTIPLLSKSLQEAAQRAVKAIMYDWERCSMVDEDAMAKIILTEMEGFHPPISGDQPCMAIDPKAFEKLADASESDLRAKCKTIISLSHEKFGNDLFALEDGWPYKDYPNEETKGVINWASDGIDKSENNPYSPDKITFDSIRYMMAAWNIAPLIAQECLRLLDARIEFITVPDIDLPKLAKDIRKIFVHLKPAHETEILRHLEREFKTTPPRLAQLYTEGM